MTENGIYVVTASTLNHRLLFNTDRKRDLLERIILSKAKLHRWDLEAWAVFANHYHFVARGNPDSMNLGDLSTGCIPSWHGLSMSWTIDLIGSVAQLLETRLTYQHAYLARLKYVHQNAVRHGLVATGNQYPWCSAAWFERVASVAQVKTIYRFKIDSVQVPDDFGDVGTPN